MVCTEPHSKWAPGGQEREVHHHVILRMTSTFAHARLNNDLSKMGAKGWFSFSRVGFPAYLAYVLVPSAKKLLKDLDAAPHFWPPSFGYEDAMRLIKSVPLSHVARSPNGAFHEQVQADLANRPPKKRKTLDFSEFTDYIVENRVRTEAQVWKLAAKLKTQGEVCLWNYLESKNVQATLNKALKGWHADSIAPSMFEVGSKFSLEDFLLPPLVEEWLNHFLYSKTLVLSGRGGLGKTELACSLLASVGDGSYYFLGKLDTVKSLSWSGKESLLVDDLTLAGLHIDDAKSWCDNTKVRYAACRHEDGYLPPGARIFSTNSDYGQGGGLVH